MLEPAGLAGPAGPDADWADGPDDVEGPALVRFSAVERAAHWCNATLFAVLVLTGAALYFTPLIAVVGRRQLVEQIHLAAGLALPVPVLVALLGRPGRALRADLRRLNRWSAADRTWMRATWKGEPVRARMRAGLAVGKFNAGQKLNAAFTAGGGLVMLGTGVILRWPAVWPLAWREGATFVHDWLFILFVVVIGGHIVFAVGDPAALVSMVTGRIPRRWARRHAPAWLVEMDAGASGSPPVRPPRPGAPSR